MTHTLAIGHYEPEEIDAFQSQFAALVLPDLAAMAALDPALREGVRIVAYKGHEPFGPLQMDGLPGLGLIANYGVGHDAIDGDAARARGITITITPDVLNEDVADLALCMWIAACRGVMGAAAYLHRGDWVAGQPLALGTKASGRKVGIVGMGRIGRAVADRLAPFGCEIHYTARADKGVAGMRWHATPRAMAQDVDDLIVTIVGGEQTRNLIGHDTLAALGPGYIINVARGSVIDEDALVAALKEGRLAGAALDVFAHEPQANAQLLALPNVLSLPHIGSATVQTRAAMASLQRANIAAFLAGAPLPSPVP
ncbi:2-hydroxyacid dehydrogenase [Roseicyclus sp.]|uniref:2-hydroxyacid dehydrogenase n=1 Tax=Roseicyclus sp. TaxID=1914329 RepID=UPI003F6D8B9D